MTCRPERIWRPLLAGLGLLAVTACSDAAVERAPLEQAQAALAAGDGLGAENALRGMLASGTPQEEIAAYLGEAELLQGELHESRRWLGEGNFSDATAGHGYHMLGRLEMRDGNLPAAGQAFDRAFASIPDSSGLWVDIGRLRYRGGEQAQAIEASRRAVELGPENPDALLLRAQLVRDSEGLAAAVPWFEAGLESAPDNLDLLGDYAATLGDLGRARDMLAIIRRMAEIDDRNPRLFYLQAVLAARGGNFMLARTLLARAGPGIAQSPAGMLLSGVIDLENGNYQSAVQVLDRLAMMQPDNVRVRELLVQAVALGLNDRELVYRFDNIGRLTSASPYLRMALGRSYEVLDRRSDAAAFLDLAALDRPSSLIAVQGSTPLPIAELRRAQGGSAVQSLVRGRIAAGQPGVALAEAERFRRLFPGSADAMALAGDARLANREPGAALSLYRKAAEIRQTWPLVRRMVAAHRASGRSDLAEQAITQHLVAHPGNAEAAAALAEMAVERADWPRAAMLLDHATRHGAWHDPYLWRQRALVAARLGDSELSFDAAIFAYALQPMSRPGTDLLAGVLAEQGQQAEADALQRKLARMGG